MNTPELTFSDLKPERESLGFLLSDTTRLIRRVCAAYLDEHQMTLAQMRALVYLARNQGMRQVELADLLDIQPITLARLIDQLAETGLVERRADPTDRRAFKLFLMPNAAPLISVLSEQAGVFQQQALAGLTPDEIAVFFYSLNKVRDNLSAQLR